METQTPTPDEAKPSGLDRLGATEADRHPIEPEPATTVVGDRAEEVVDPEHPNLLARGYTAARGEIIGSASRIQAAGLNVIDEAIHYAEGSLLKAKAQDAPHQAVEGIGDELRVLRACRRLTVELNKIAEGQQARARLLGGQ